MGTGLLLLVVLGVAVFFLGRKLGMLGFFQTLGNRSRSRFRRSESDGQIIFKITPARPSLAAVIAIALGVALLWRAEALCSIAWFGLLPIIMGAMAFPIGARYRRFVTITIAADAIHSGGKSWRLQEIADFNVRRGSRINADEPAPVIHRTAAGGLVYGGKSTSAMFSRALNRRAIERSYLVTLRTRADSDEKVLSGGLTLDCADALRGDLRDAVSTRANAPIGGVA